MKRYWVLILFAIVLVAPWVVARFVNKEEITDVREGTLRLDIVTPHNQDIRNEFSLAFSRWHEAKYGAPVALLFNAPGGTGEVKRLLEATYRDATDKDGKLKDTFKPPFDLAWGGGDFFFDREIFKFLQPMQLPDGVLRATFPSPTLAGYKLYDSKTTAVESIPATQPGAAPTTRAVPAPKWVGVCISSFGIVYNPDVYRRLGLEPPRTWSDLALPQLSGWVALANPMSSSSAAVSYMMCVQRAMADAEAAYFNLHPEVAKLPSAERTRDAGYKAALADGWKKGLGTLLRIAANARYITDSGTQPPNDVANGDAAVGIAIDFYGRANEEAVGRDRTIYVQPKGATALNPDPIAILAGVHGQRYQLANRFIEFLLTPEAQRLWITKPGAKDGPLSRALFRPPIRADLYTTSDLSLWTHPDLNPFTDAQGFNQRGEWMGTFSQVRLIWAVSWIDAREELRAAYAAVLRVSDPAQRTALLAKLAESPITLPDVEAWQKELATVKPTELDAYNARKRLDLARQFRSHFREVQYEATRSPVAAQ